MPVRIIFRGLILFSFPKGSEPDAGKLVARLINKPDIPRRAGKETSDRPPHGPHEHNHGAQIQIAADHGVNDERAPLDLAPPRNGQPGERIDITFVDRDDEKKKLPATEVGRESSFNDHVPYLPEVIRRGTDEVRKMKRGDPDDRLVRNVITVDRGMVRVRQVVTWDAGGFPIDAGRRAQLAAAPAYLKFVGSDLQGHMASEFVVDVLDENAAVRIESSVNKRLNRIHKPRGVLNHRTPYDTVEILITNYEFQENTAIPWGMDFQWLFEAVGYPAVDLEGDNLREFTTLGSGFNRAVYEHERRMLLDPVAGGDRDDTNTYRVGRPFPYLSALTGLTPLKQQLAATDEEDRPICIGGQF